MASAQAGALPGVHGRPGQRYLASREGLALVLFLAVGFLDCFVATSLYDLGAALG